VSSGSPSTPASEPTTISLYEKWKKIHPLWVSGGFQTWRRIVLVVLVFVYYVNPWLSSHGEPGVRFDLVHRRFTVFWTTFVPEEFVLLAWLLLIAALVLFTVTVAAGRVFCGWACPQTVWSLVYFTIERFVEGDRNARLRLDRGGWTRNRITRKTLKYTLWALVALSISITFVGYFQPIRELLPRIATFELGKWERVFILLPAAGSFFFSGVLREQVCFHMCPYARFQSVMFDRDSLIISYDEDRGEPRGNRARDADPMDAGLGSCIDCRKCVNVCPTGIDIRDGLQYECIGCAACVDACGEVMETMGYGASLVRYSSENRDQNKASRLMRPRLVGYLSLILALVFAFSFSVASRIPLDLDIARDRNRLFRESWDGSVENVYTLQVSNRESVAREYEISFESNLPLQYLGDRSVHVGAGATKPVHVSLRLPGDAELTGDPLPVLFSVRSTGDSPVEVKKQSPFRVPETRWSK
jgi:cytochrome c oxidase accessory protein FixG